MLKKKNYFLERFLRNVIENMSDSKVNIGGVDVFTKVLIKVKRAKFRQDFRPQNSCQCNQDISRDIHG